MNELLKRQAFALGLVRLVVPLMFSSRILH